MDGRFEIKSPEAYAAMTEAGREKELARWRELIKYMIQPGWRTMHYDDAYNVVMLGKPAKHLVFLLNSKSISN